MGYILLLVLFVILPLFAIGLFFGGIRLFGRVESGVTLIVMLFLFEAAVVYLPSVYLGIRVYPTDFGFGLIAAVATIRLLTQPMDRITVLWLLFGALGIGLFLAGLPINKTVAGVEYRPYFYFWAATAYVAAFRLEPDTIHLIRRRLYFAAIGLVVIAVFRWTDQIVGLTGIQWGLMVGANKWRVLNSSHAEFLLLVWLLLVADWAMGHLGKWGASALLILTVMLALLQHRTVWVDLLACTAILALAYPDIRQKLLRTGIPLLMILGATVAVIGATGSLDPAADALGRSVTEVFQGRGSTLSWRVESWQELLRKWAGSGPAVLLFGHPFGSGYERYVEDMGHVTNYSPHSFYVQTLLRGGLVGLGLLLSTFILSIIRLYRTQVSAMEEGIPARVLAIILIGLLIYGIAYSPAYAHGLFFGLALAILRCSRAQENQATVKPTLTARSAGVSRR